MSRGFSVVEIVIVLAIVGILTSISLSTYKQTRHTGDAKMAATAYATLLKSASLKARTMEYDSAWGVRVQTGSITLFSGNTYATRTISRDKVIDTDSSVSISGQSEVTFAKFSGTPATIGTTTFSNAFASSSVNVSTTGVITH